MPPRPPSFDELGDATRRTWLASERTMLAWLRTGLTATAVALAVGKVIPDLTGTRHSWPFVALGIGYAVLGVVLVVFGLWRAQAVDDAIREGRFVVAGPGAWLLGAAVALLSLASVVVLVAEA